MQRNYIDNILSEVTTLHLIRRLFKTLSLFMLRIGESLFYSEDEDEFYTETIEIACLNFGLILITAHLVCALFIIFQVLILSKNENY